MAPPDRRPPFAAESRSPENPSPESLSPQVPSSEAGRWETLAQAVRVADLRGTSQLATEATMEATRLVEAVHASVLSAVRRRLRGTRHPSESGDMEQARGLTGWIYRAIRRSVRFWGGGTTRVLKAVERTAPPAPPPHTEARDRLVSVLNGVLGDHLSATGNPLARSFSLHAPDGSPFDPDCLSSDTLVVFVHGLCLSDRCWMRPGDAVDALEDANPEGATPKSSDEASESDRSASGHVGALAAALDATPVLARYNTGLHTWANGRLLSEHLEALMSGAAASSRVVLVAHSMGGLVVRSAFRYARRAESRWPDGVTETVYLGTPHEGAPLERAGAWVEEQLRRTAFTMPAAALAGVRSEGIQDLGHGATAPNAPSLPSDPSSTRSPDPGRSVYVAASLVPDRPGEDAIGDGLVPVSSALRESDTSPSAMRRVFANCGHLRLLHDRAVTEYLVEAVGNPLSEWGARES